MERPKLEYAENCTLIHTYARKLEKYCDELEKELDKACKFIDKATCSCPYDSMDEKMSNCNAYDCKDQLAECWKEYFLKKASE